MSDTIASPHEEMQMMSLRERKKHLVETTIEETALRLFQQKGYEQTSIQDIADAVIMSTRTFFRYFASKEEVLLGSMHAVLNESLRSLQHVASIESPHTVLRATFLYLASLYQQQRDSFLIRYRVATQTPAIASLYLYALLEREPMISDALCSHLAATANRHEIRTLVAVYMTAFRLALEVWLGNGAQEDLAALLCEHLDYFSSLFQQTRCYDPQNDR
jgi:AcrR family transcriptional regulator